MEAQSLVTGPPGKSLVIYFLNCHWPFQHGSSYNKLPRGATVGEMAYDRTVSLFISRETKNQDMEDAYLACGAFYPKT